MKDGEATRNIFRGRTAERSRPRLSGGDRDDDWRGFGQNRGRQAAHAALRLNAAQRVMGICNACRYCEGFSAVSPPSNAERFSPGKSRLSPTFAHNLFFGTYACPIRRHTNSPWNIPKLFAELPSSILRECARPQTFFPRSLCAHWSSCGSAKRDPGRRGDFYRVIPHSTMIAIFGLAAAFAIVMLVASVARFWRKSAGKRSPYGRGSDAPFEPPLGAVFAKSGRQTAANLQCISQRNDARIISPAIRVILARAASFTISRSTAAALLRLHRGRRHRALPVG